MRINDFLIKNHIAVFVEVDIRNKEFNIRKSDIKLESDDLFKQLIIFGNAENLIECVTGQLLPRIWTQGNSKCIVCKPNEEKIVALFYDTCLDAKNHYFYAKQIETQVFELY